MLLVLAAAALMPADCIEDLKAQRAVAVSHHAMLNLVPPVNTTIKQHHQESSPLLRRDVAQQFSQQERAAIAARSKVGILTWTQISSVSAAGAGLLNMTGRGYDGSNASLGSNVGKWKDSSRYFRRNLAECKDICLRNSECIGFVDVPVINATVDEPQYPKSCVFRAEMQLDGQEATQNYSWYHLEINWTKKQNFTVSGYATYDVFDWDHTPNCTVNGANASACNEVCRQTETTDVNKMCNVWSQDRSKFYYDKTDELHSLLHCEQYCRDAPACLGFVDVWADPPYCMMKTKVTVATAISKTANPAVDVWQMK